MARTASPERSTNAARAAGESATANATPADTLRQQTADLHEQVEDRVRVSERLGSLQQYAELLQFFRRTLEPVESWLNGHPVTRTIPGPRADCVALLRQDLTALRAAGAGVAPDPAVTAFAPPGGGDATVLGVLYVVEGSMLGGLFIAKAAGRSLGLTESSGAAFFGRGRVDGMDGWRRFKSHLNDRLCTAGDVDAAVAAARGTFDHFLKQAEGLS